MTNQVKSVMIVDDNKIDNFFNERVIKKNDASWIVIAKESPYDALDYLKAGEQIPDVIFLDVNMPGMSGWDFIEEYKKLAISHNDVLIVIFTCNHKDPDDETLELVKGISCHFSPKPLTIEILEQVQEKYSSLK
ncbi:response regulator [Flavobacterium sp. DGU11]|uniref:Response regulator n=1 Tax=Flavobacterium arundinis TaxID=3139143 RepID=A0ABU9HTF0_9FLAO